MNKKLFVSAPSPLILSSLLFNSGCNALSDIKAITSNKNVAYVIIRLTLKTFQSA